MIVPDLGVAAPRESRLRMFRDVIESSNMHQQHQHKDKTVKQLNNVKPNNIKQRLFLETKNQGCYVYLEYVGATHVEWKSPPIQYVMGYATPHLHLHG